MALVSGRSLIAAGVIALWMGWPRLTLSLPQLGGGLALAATQIFFVIATRETSAANAIFIQYTAPVFVALFGIWYLREPAKLQDWLTMGAIGVGLLLFLGDGFSAGGMAGNLVALLSGVTLAWFFLFMREQKDGSPVETVFLGNVFAALAGLPWLVQAAPTSADVGGVLVLGIFQLGIPFILMSLAIKHLTAVEAILIQTLEPILNPVWVFWVIGERPTPLALVGGVIVLLAVTTRSLLAARPQRTKVLA